MHPTTSPRTMRSGLALLAGAIGTTLLLAVGVAVGAVPRLVDTDPAIVAAVEDVGEALPAPAPVTDPTAVAPTTIAAPPDSAPEPEPVVTPTTIARATPTTAPPTTPPPTAAVVEPAPPAPAPPRLPPGQRVEATSAQVQAAMATLHQRVPLFAPTEPQLRTFAEAVCASFDQGQSQAQVQSTVRQAVTHIAGASLSPADADYSVQTVVQLRCPGYLP